jgi:hypothetical protein
MQPDFRELIPEFFTLPDFLVNSNRFDLGTMDESPVTDVTLPPWAKNAHEFIEIHRAALESVHVSAHLHEWIDLIFGFQQTGPAAAKANNLFHLFSYPSAITAEVLKDPDMLTLVQTQASNMGITPRQIFKEPHPRRGIVPLFPRFRGPQLRVLLKLNVPPRAVFVDEKRVYILGTDSGFQWIKFPEIGSKVAFVPECVPMGSISQFLAQSPDEAIPSKSFAFFSSFGRFVSSSIWDNCFHVFKCDHTTITHNVSLRQKFALISTLNYAGETLLLTSWRDSSLTLWNLASRSHKPLYRTTPHLTSVVDVDVSVSLGLIASLDKGRKLIFSLLRTGKFVRSVQVEGSDVLQRIILFSAGYVAVLSESGSETLRKSAIRLYGLNTIQVGAIQFDELVVEWTRAEFGPGLTGVALAFKSGRISILQLPALSDWVTIQHPKKIVSMVCGPRGSGFLLFDAECSVLQLETG